MNTLLTLLLFASLLFSPDTELLEIISEPNDEGLVEAVSLDKNTKANNGYWLDADKHKKGTLAIVNFTDDDVHKEYNFSSNSKHIFAMKKVLTKTKNYEP